jgi:serine/threonine protein kinase
MAYGTTGYGMMDELIGATIGHYRITQSLGQGGMAAVYKAYQENLDREVAIKILPEHYSHNANFVARFKLEARALARLNHPNIVTVHDAGEFQRRLYIVMAYIPGGTLRERLDRPLPVTRVVEITRAVAAALGYAHERNIIHRDVKPANVLMDLDGRPVLSDFGIAKVVAEETGEQLTSTGTGIGTPEYMAPEQCRGLPVDSRSDIYALGVMAYEMFTGRTPFQGAPFTAVIYAQIHEPPPPPSHFNPQIPPAVDAVILQALAKDPDQRFQRATDFADALERACAISRSGPVARALVLLICPYCRAGNPAINKFCARCGMLLGGASTVTVAQCVCGVLNPAGQMFCKGCGRRLL